MSGIINKQPLLSICIPTWNREKILAESLNRFKEQLTEIDVDDIELYVSDNASIDSTPTVVKGFIEQGLPITYNRNPENVGAARNFIRCIQWSNGKYIWLLGDDDFLQPGALKLIVDTLKEGEFGLLHLYTFGTKKEQPQIIDDVKNFIHKVSYYATFMSGNIFNRDIVEKIGDPSRYIDTHLLQMPYFIEAILYHEKNAIVGTDLILQAGVDSANNGGYNFFEVFVRSYLDLWKERLAPYGMMEEYDFIRKHIFTNFTVGFIIRLLILKKGVSVEYEHKYTRMGWRIENGWKILKEYYGDTGYFYGYIPVKTCVNTAKMLIKKIVRKK
jgi:glycosyltransferase involved in cell wall biosynthesis